ncbi:hypothetical protein GGTG_06581 [Gaeumannomyces tritici R3-111a-1]|uniref:Uncharacterized protein n=1 Tax=Gaeumannomyces tritici (strain R3-111a-1) TaxID=644352 RepID=J3NZ81_GAET3|nr:hypothetical protein GGTG_06581 [Gaeumannomyces tritici R3-111a-1]EJT76664.1 hypothetical protein GGTG_06581 [Gaeumannomyces tritici R3-111a-1]
MGRECVAEKSPSIFKGPQASQAGELFELAVQVLGNGELKMDCGVGLLVVEDRLLRVNRGLSGSAGEKSKGGSSGSSGDGGAGDCGTGDCGAGDGGAGDGGASDGNGDGAVRWASASLPL